MEPEGTCCRTDDGECGVYDEDPFDVLADVVLRDQKLGVWAPPTGYLLSLANEISRGDPIFPWWRHPWRRIRFAIRERRFLRAALR